MAITIAIAIVAVGGTLQLPTYAFLYKVRFMAYQLSTMGDQYAKLYNRIQSFAFDQSNESLFFSRRLARENTWSNEYTERVIEEYRKFVFLAVVAGHPVTPPDQVRLPTNINNQRDVLNPYEVAFLADGKERMVKAAIASLVKRGYLEVAKTSDLRTSLISGSRKLVLIKTPESTANSIEKAVARAVQSSDGSLNQVMAKAVHLEQNLRERLQRLGMLVSDEQAVKAQLYPILIMVGLIGLGLCKILLGITRGKPVGFLMIAVFMILVFGLGFLRKPSRSQYGDRTLNDLTARSRDLRDLQDETNLALAVALFGTSVLRNDGALMDLYRMFPHPNDDDDRMSPHYYSSSTNDDSGAGEGSGGGCGGCGGCGGGGD